MARTLSIPPKKLAEIAQLCRSWNTKTYCSKRALQSLLGSLLYISKSVKPARIFLNRMLSLLRSNHNVNKILLNQPFFQAWFNTFLEKFNGVTYYEKKFPHAQVHLDSMVYALEIPIGYNSYDICHLEMLNIVRLQKSGPVTGKIKKSKYIVTTWRWYKSLIQAKPGIPY